MSQLHENPFIYGRPVRGEQFFGRQLEINTVLNRLRNKESTAIVGAPHTGKTSLLMRLADNDVLVDKLGIGFAAKIIPSPINLHDLPESYTPNRFWEDALEPLRVRSGNNTISQLIQLARNAMYDHHTLEKLFKKLAENDRALLLLLDEFEVVLKHKNFQDSSFFAGLRKLSSLTEGLVVVTASRLSIVDMNEIGRGLLDVGSPFFNTMIQVSLKPFDDYTIAQFLSQPGSIIVKPNQRAFIQCMAGRHPFVLQAMAAAFQDNPTNPGVASEICYERIAFHFSDLWISLPENCRTTAVILSLSELGGKIRGKNFELASIENNEKFEVELRNLAQHGLAELVQKTGYWINNWNYLFSSGDKKWAIGTLLFAWWVRDQMMSSSSGGLYMDWLKGKHYKDWLTFDEWQQIQALGEIDLISLALSVFSDLGVGD